VKPPPGTAARTALGTSGRPSTEWEPGATTGGKISCEEYPDGIGFLGWQRASRRRLTVQLKLSTRTVDDILVVDCAGRIVFGEESAELRETVKKLIAQSGRIVLNLAHVSYIDSGGLGTLVALYTTARNAGGSIKLANLTERVGDLLQVTKLLTVFEVFDSEKGALESFRTAA
jgi:anti-sigma B factor antagonist